MKKALSSLIILLNFASYSYGMSGDMFYDRDDIPGTSFSFERTQQQKERERQRRRREKEEDADEYVPKRQALEPRISLPSLRVLHEQGNSNIELGQSLLETLPAEIHTRLIELLPAQALPQLALVSNKWRNLAQAAVTDLSILVTDITPQELETIKNRFPKVKSLYIKGTGITPQQISLLGEYFPELESLNLWSTGMTAEHSRALSAPGLFTSLKGLDVSFNYLGDEGLEALTQAPFADTLTVLNLNSTGLTGVAIRILAESGKFKALKHLNLANNPIELQENDSLDKIVQENGGIRFLPQAAFANTLESLDLGNTGLLPEDMEMFAQKEKFKSLKRLDLSENHIRGEELEYLTQAAFTRTLEFLSLSKNPYDEAEDELQLVEVLAKPNTFNALKVLKLSYTVCGPEDTSNTIRTLAQAPFAAQLEELQVLSRGDEAEIQALVNNFTSLKRLNLDITEESPDSNINAVKGNAVIKILAQAPLAQQLEHLSLSSLPVTDTVITTLIQPGIFTSLKKLHLNSPPSEDKEPGSTTRAPLRSAPSGDTILELLTQAPFADKLESLKLQNTGITAEGIRRVACSGKFKKLKKLTLNGSKIDDNGLQALAQAPFANTLVSLSLQANSITDLGLQALALPHLFTSLKNLNLDYNQHITDTGIGTLAQAPFARNQLEALSVDWTQVENQAIDTLHELRSFFALKQFTTLDKV